MTDITTTKATRREWIGLFVLALPTLLLSLDVSVLYLALPKLTADLGADSTQQLWILDIYSFLLAGFLVTMGTLGDRIGRRKLLLIGAAVFGAASVLAAYASSPELLIACRALLGLAGATLMPSTLALIRNMFHDPVQLGQAIGVWFGCFMVGMLIGPVVGGLLLEQFWWGSAFLLGVPVMLLLLILGPALLPEYRDPAAGRLDPASVGLSLVAILPTIWGLKALARDGWSVLGLVAIMAGIAAGTGFVRRQRRLDYPLLDVDLFRAGRFTAALTVSLAAGVVMAGVSLQAALYLQVVEELSPLRAGLWLIPQTVAMIAGLNLAPHVARRFGTSSTVAGGLVVAAAGLLVLGLGSLETLIAGLVVSAFGLSLPMALTMNLMLSAAPPERAGSVASLSETSGEGGIALGVALLGTLGTIVYRDRLDLPEGVPAGIAERARSGVSEAVVVADSVGGSLGGAIEHAAKAAFGTGLTVVAVAGAAAFLACGLLAALALRERAAAEADLVEQEKVAEAA
ncbi:DHA2 family multidrug resistance protein-like MFS transporter [Kribbella amoyensis]|uniref:DHA2 family multidrug resistance protein-like MFS transporter n=1 Tax=Kribbella amoyensis TaxID=996641 RepID=A0A561B2E6_9ACTN|nr:MFS transporter [Kribbella amoyensis]TWD73031.1 DHA2 family multidrug resistance protein-like MFS transporter [Kribbella amoyensis]